MGRLIAETTASGGTVCYGYNELNVKKQLTNARGHKRKYFYDACGRITGYVGREDSVSYTYDANGNVLTVTDNNGTTKREYDSLNRVVKYTDTFGKAICYEYDAVGNLTRLVYPDNTCVTYSYDANNNLASVTDWANRITTYSYDVNNRVIGVLKPDGSAATTVYDSNQRIISTVEKRACGEVITGFEYTYDALGKIIEEKSLAHNTKIWYTYDSLNRVTNRTVKDECDNVVSSESYTYDAAGNITDAPNNCFSYDTNNRLAVFDGYPVFYDADGNMLGNGSLAMEYDSANRLIKAGNHKYTYNAEDVRIRNLCSDADTTYTYNTNCKLSQLLTKTTNGTVTKYVYGLGLIGEEKCGEFKTYHFDYRGSTVAITNESGIITDTFKYDTYGKVTEHIGNSFVIFGYNGRDGVVTDKNGLIYMRARYYNPTMRRFVNADIIHGEISDSTSLNRYSYVNGNPVSFVDPFGLIAERGQYGIITYNSLEYPIFIPGMDKTYISSEWKIVKQSKKYFTDTDWETVLAGLQLDNADMKYGTDKSLAVAALVGSIASIFSSIASNTDKYYINVILQSNGDSRQAVVTFGTDKIKEIVSSRPKGFGFSSYTFNNLNNGLEFVEANNKTKALYNSLTGKTLSGSGWDFEMHFDPRWHTNSDFAYLGINQSGNLIGKSIVYSGDKLTVGKRSGLFNLKYTPSVNVPLKSRENEMPDELVSIFNDLLKREKMTIKH